MKNLHEEQGHEKHQHEEHGHEKHQHEEHGHEHNHDISGVSGTKLIFIVLLNFIITAAEVVGGLYAGSLSLISDALHNFSDGISFIISYLAIKIADKTKDEKKTFGYKRATILAALVNSSVLIVISIYLFKEAYFKFIDPQKINGEIVIWVAFIGLVANIIGVMLLQNGSKKDMNLKSSYLHLLSDALSSVAVVIGGVLIYYFKIYWIDPVLTILIGLFVMKESLEIVKKAVHILMQGTPEDIDIEEIVEAIQRIENVGRVHHVHAWSLDESNINFEAHINVKDMLVSDTKKILEEIKHELLDFGINHVTIQFEYDSCDGVDIIKE